MLVEELQYLVVGRGTTGSALKTAHCFLVSSLVYASVIKPVMVYLHHKLGSGVNLSYLQM